MTKDVAVDPDVTYTRVATTSEEVLLEPITAPMGIASEVLQHVLLFDPQQYTFELASPQ